MAYRTESSSPAEDEISSQLISMGLGGLPPAYVDEIRAEVEQILAKKAGRKTAGDASRPQSSLDFYSNAVNYVDTLLDEAKQVFHLIHHQKDHGATTTSSEFDESEEKMAKMEEVPSTSHHYYQQRHSLPDQRISQPTNDGHRRFSFERPSRSLSPAPMVPSQPSENELDEMHSLIESAKGLHESVGGWKQEMAQQHQNIMVRLTDAADLVRSANQSRLSSKGGRKQTRLDKDREKLVESAMRGLAMEFQSNGMKPEDSFLPLREVTNYVKQLERSKMEEDKVLQPCVRPVRCPEPGCPPFKHDPVKRFEVYSAEWKKISVPGENKRQNLRWQIRELMMCQDIPALVR